MRTTTTIVWRGLDAPRMEIAHVSIDGTSVSASGTQVGAGYELKYELLEAELRVCIVGGTQRTYALDDADFFDLGFSPLFNTLPIVRDGLLQQARGQGVYTMKWISVPELSVEQSVQCYDRLSARRVLFTAGDFQVDLTFDATCLVETYPGLAERIYSRTD